MIIAHRGYSRVAPENTIASFSEAMRVQSDYVELDFHLTKDGDHIVIHDDFYDRTTNIRALTGLRKVEVATTASKITHALSAGLWFSSEFAQETVPRLEDALRHIDQLQGRVLMDHKTGDATHILQLISKLGIAEQIMVQSDDWNFLRKLRLGNPDIKIAMLGRGIGIIRLGLWFKSYAPTW